MQRDVEVLLGLSSASSAGRAMAARRRSSTTAASNTTHNLDFNCPTITISQQYLTKPPQYPLAFIQQLQLQLAQHLEDLYKCLFAEEAGFQVEAALFVAVEGAETLQVVLAVFGELRAGWQPFGL